MPDGTQSELRMIVKVNHGHPELREELVKLPARHRAERLRMLAHVGLRALGQGPAAPALTAVPTGPVVSPKNEALEARRERLLKRMRK